MKTTTKGGIDTDTAKTIANHDSGDNKTSVYLLRTAEGKYFLRTETLQASKGGEWIDHPMDGSTESVTSITENEAIDWYLATIAPEALAKAIQQQIGYLVSCELGELAEPLARYCKEHGVTESEAAKRSLDWYVNPTARTSETEKAIAYLQSAVVEKYGRDFDTDSGAGTILISHDRVSLTNPNSSIVAQRANSIARQLTAAKIDN